MTDTATPTRRRRLAPMGTTLRGNRWWAVIVDGVAVGTVTDLDGQFAAMLGIPQMGHPVPNRRAWLGTYYTKARAGDAVAVVTSAIRHPWSD